MQEKVAQQLLYRRKARQFHRCYADKGLLEYNQDRLYDRYLKWKAKEINSRQIILNLQNNPLGNMATIPEVFQAMAPLLAQIPQYDRQEPPDTYHNKVMQAISYGTNLAVAAFNDAMKVTVLSGKMAGRFIPPNPFNNAASNAVNTPALFQAWLRDKYREVKIGTAQASMKALMHEKFHTIDTPETYEKRIRPYVDAMPYADALPILCSHLPENLELRIKISNPADLNAFFTELNNKWLEGGGPSMTARAIQQIPDPSQTLAIQPQKDDFKVRLARDLQYSGISSDDAALEQFIYDELDRRLGGKSAHIRKSPFAPRSAYATKKVVRKVAPKKTIKIIRHCSICGKTGHTKTRCSRVKRTKKVNYVIQDDSEDPEDLEYIVEEEDGSEEAEIEDDNEYVDDPEGCSFITDDDESNLSSSSRNCHAVKKKWSEVEYL